VRDQLRALIELAGIDSKAKSIDDRLQGIPAELAERRQAIRKLEDLVTRQRAILTEAEQLLSTQEKDIAGRNEALSRAKQKGAKARNQREAEAAERELDAVRRSIKDGDGEKDRLKERLVRTTASLAEPEKALAEQKAELEVAEAASVAKLEELRHEREKVVAGRDEWTRKIDKQWLRTYERLRGKVSPMVAEVAGEICSQCRMRVAPQRFIQIRQAKEVMQCQSCLRFQYHKDLLVD
jgi:uncharacterized protein